MVQDEALRALSELVARPDWLSLEPQELAWAGRDAAGDYRLYGVADRIGRVWAVVHPRTSQEVAAVVRWAARYQVPLVARGGGTGVMGGA
ncbi:MAG: FAD-dependent oxidoreductase, partial [Firmicutes bacterium]|nr:FAD-dependent oxidoreductase [Bacillota bacterium]